MRSVKGRGRTLNPSRASIRVARLEVGSSRPILRELKSAGTSDTSEDVLQLVKDSDGLGWSYGAGSVSGRTN
jgi:hypothetical protein